MAAVGENEPLHTFEHEEGLWWYVQPRRGRIIISQTKSISPDEHILDFQGRTAASLHDLAELRMLTFDGWMTKKRALEAIHLKKENCEMNGRPLIENYTDNSPFFGRHSQIWRPTVHGGRRKCHLFDASWGAQLMEISADLWC